MSVEITEASNETGVSLEEALSEFDDIINEADSTVLEAESVDDVVDDGEQSEITDQSETADQSEIEDLNIVADSNVETPTSEELNLIEATIEKEKIYEEQPVTTPIEVSEVTAASTDDDKKKIKSPSKRKGGRSVRSLASVPAEFFVLEEDPAKLDQSRLDAIKDEVINLRPLQTKIGEKFDNLFISLAAGREPSRYTKMAFTYLLEKGEATNSDVVKMYQAAGLREGTARSQTGQMMTLFSCCKIANRSGQTLTLLPNNTITNRLRDLLVPEPTIAEAA